MALAHLTQARGWQKMHLHLASIWVHTAVGVSSGSGAAEILVGPGKTGGAKQDIKRPLKW
jgi:hypothetical protein